MQIQRTRTVKCYTLWKIKPHGYEDVIRFVEFGFSNISGFWQVLQAADCDCRSWRYEIQRSGSWLPTSAVGKDVAIEFTWGGSQIGNQEKLKSIWISAELNILSKLLLFNLSIFTGVFKVNVIFGKSNKRDGDLLDLYIHFVFELSSLFISNEDGKFPSRGEGT